MATGASGAANLWARRELRRRWVPLLVLGLLAGVAASVALASFAGARRSASAWDRLGEVTGAADAVVFASQVDIFGPDVDWTEVAELPYVEAAGSFGIPFVSVVDGPEGMAEQINGMFSVPFGEWRTDVDRPVIVEGRLPDPDDPLEVLAPPGAREAGIEVGQEYTVRLPSEEQLAAMDLFGDPQGEEVVLTVVGIGRSTFELATIPGEGAGWVTTPAFHDQYAAPVTFIDNLLVRFRPGQGSVAQLERDARQIFDSPRMPVLDTQAASKRVTNGTDLESVGLTLFGLAVALAGAVLVGQALTRSVRAGAVDLPPLHAMGFTRPDGARALALPHLSVVGVAAVAAAGGAVALSPLFPIGLGRSVEPDPGVHVDWTVLGVGVPLTAAVLLATVAVSAYRATAINPSSRPVRRSRIVSLLAGTNAGPSVLVGAGLALEPGRDRRALPTRPALAGVAMGVIGVIGAQSLLVAIDDAIAHPARFGTNWDLEMSINDFSGALTFDDAMARVEEDDDVEATALAGKSLLVVDGVTTPTWSVTPREGALDFTVLEGRRPETLGEVALGPETASALDVEVGDGIEVVDADGSTRALDVVGTALVPTTPHSNYYQGAWVNRAQQVALAGAEVGELPGGVDPSAESATPPVLPTHLVALREGTDAQAVAGRISGGLDTGLHDLRPPDPPLDATNLRNVRPLPLLFAIFTTVLAVGTVAHVSASVVRRRGSELAVLRALGMTGGGIRAALGWQATTLSVIGLVVGVPIGVAIGRVSWRVVADHTPLVFAPPLALAALLLAVPLTVLVANLIAAYPGWRAARLHPADQLRHE
jgi:hypothetical protein